MRSLTRFRLGLTSLRAVGYTNLQAPFPERVCRQCPCAWRNINVDDEHHLLFECAHTASQRRDHSALLPAQSVRALSFNGDQGAPSFVCKRRLIFTALPSATAAAEPVKHSICCNTAPQVPSGRA